MKTITKAAIAASAAACATMLSFDWSEQSGISLSVEKAQARVGRPLTPLSGAGVARRQYRRAAYGGYGGYGYGLAGAAAVGTAAAVASSPDYGPGFYGDDQYYGPGVSGPRAAYYGSPRDPNYQPGVWGARAAYYGTAPAASADTGSWNLVNAYHAGGPWYGYGGWADYKARNSIVCDPGTSVTAADGAHYLCQ